MHESPVVLPRNKLMTIIRQNGLENVNIRFALQKFELEIRLYRSLPSLLNLKFQCLKQRETLK